MIQSRQVVIVGGGFSGSLLAINLLRYEGPRTVLVERRPAQLARGVAYGTAHDGHILNVRAANMSAYPDKPDHFRQWLEASGEGGAVSFVSRGLYGRYLGEQLAIAQAAAPSRLQLVHDEVEDVRNTRDGVTVMLAGGRVIPADTVVLAQGNLPPHALPQASGITDNAHVYHADPWDVAIGEDLSSRDVVLLVGAGLTAVDVALTLKANGFAGRIVALSRRGLLPRAHDAAQHGVSVGDRPPFTGSRLVAHVRNRADTVGWRGAIDELRPHTQNIWASASVEDRSRFLRHLRPYWDVHRHRLAPQVAKRVNALEETGELIALAGHIVSIAPANRGANVIWRPRGTHEERTLRVAKVVNCTGPQGDLLRTTDRLLRTLVVRGVVRPDSLRLGIDVNQQGRILSHEGKPSDYLFALGPMTRGAFWEVVAVPDLRQQAWDLARWLSAAHWVSGEGL